MNTATATPESDPVRDEILEHMAKAFFACAWADYSERVGPHYPAGCQIMDEMPDELDPAATEAAEGLAASLEAAHGLPLSEIFRKAVEISEANDAGDRERTAEMFGHYAAMGAMGHGVGLWDALGGEACDFVERQGPHKHYVEFSMFDLDADKYPIPEDLD